MLELIAMSVLGSIRVSTFIHMSSVWILGTILLCYFLAVGYHHVQPWLPMISDCAVLSPEKYPFRFGLLVGAMGLGVQVMCVYLIEEPFSKSKLALFFGSVSSLCLGVVAVVNEVENVGVHGACATVFFFFYWFYMIILTTYATIACYKRHVESETTLICQRRLYIVANTARLVLTVVCGVCLVAFAIMSSHWSKYKLYIAICEWTGTLCILAYNWLLAVDMSSFKLAEVKSDDQVSYTKIETDETIPFTIQNRRQYS